MIDINEHNTCKGCNENEYEERIYGRYKTER